MIVEPLSESAPVSTVGDRIHVEEAWSYRVTPDAARCGEVVSVHFGDRLLAPTADGRGFRLDVPHLVGAIDLVATGTAGEERVRVVVDPRSEKIERDAWVALLEDLDRWVPGSAVGREEAREGAVGNVGTEVAAAGEALSPLIPALLDAFEAIDRMPKNRQVRQVEYVEPHRVRRVDSRLVRHLTADVIAAQAVGLTTEETDQRVRLPQRRPMTDLRHPANCYVAWAMWRIARRTRTLADWYRDAAAKHSDRSWWDTRARRLAHDAAAVARAYRRSCLRDVPRRPASEAALLSILDDPAYARFHRVARRFISPRFSLDAPPDSAAAAVRPSFELYEFWCFEALARRVAAALPDWQHKPLRDTAKGELLGLPNGKTHRFRHPDHGTLELHFNPTFQSKPDGGTKRYSITRERRPDIVATWMPAGCDAGSEPDASPDTGPGTEHEGRRTSLHSADAASGPLQTARTAQRTPPRPAWLALDAKYRVGRTNLLDAFASCHLYRDALRWPRFGGRPTACVLLTPARTAASAPWFEPAFLARHGLGAMRWTPGDASGRDDVSDPCVVEWLLDELGVRASLPSARQW